MTGGPIRRVRRRLGLLLTCGLFPLGAEGQVESPAALGLTAAYVDMETLAGSEPLSGVLYGVEGSSSLSRVRISATYRQGWLQSGAPGVQGRDVTSLHGTLGVQVQPWLVFEAGPARTTVDLPGDDRHILRWRLGGRGHAPLVVGLLNGYATVAMSIAGTGIRGLGLRDGGAGEIGLLVEPTRTLWARVGYRYEQDYLNLGWSQSIQAAFLTVGVTMPPTR